MGMYTISGRNECDDSRDIKKPSLRKRVLIFGLALSSLYWGYNTIMPEVSKIKPQVLEIKEKALGYLNLNLNLDQMMAKYTPDINVVPWANASLLPDFISENKTPSSVDYGKLKVFNEKNKDKLEVKWSGKLDIDNKGNLNYLKGVEIYKLGNAYVTYSNGAIKEVSSENLTNFLLSSILSAEDMGALKLEDLISDKEIKALHKNSPSYISDLKDAMIAKQIYTHDLIGKTGETITEGTYKILDPKFKRFEN